MLAGLALLALLSGMSGSVVCTDPRTLLMLQREELRNDADEKIEQNDGHNHSKEEEVSICLCTHSSTAADGVVVGAPMK